MNNMQQKQEKKVPLLVPRRLPRRRHRSHQVDSCSRDTHSAMDVLAVADYDACCQACVANLQCVGWIWKDLKGSGKFCHLKKNEAFVKKDLKGLVRALVRA